MITVSGLTKQYGDRTVVDDVSFTLEPGTVTGFLGPNGAGKTTTMRMITGLVPPTAGVGRWSTGGRYVDAAQPGRGRRHAARRRRRAPGPDRADAPAAARRDASACRPRRVDEVLELVGLADAGRRRIGGYSLGMRQRLGIAGALLADPPVLMFDEPANGLDPEGIRWMRELLRGHAARGGTVLLSSPPARRGRAHGRPAAGHRRRPDRRRRPGGVAAGRRRRLGARRRRRPRWPRTCRPPGFAVSAGDDGALVVAGADRRRSAPIAAAGGHVLTDLRPADRGLEDLFFQLTA